MADHIIKIATSVVSTAAGAAAKAALKENSQIVAKKQNPSEIYHSILLGSVRNIREGLALLWQLVEREAAEDVQRQKAVLGEALEETAQLSMADLRQEVPSLLWCKLPPVFEVLKSLPQDTEEDSLFQRAKQKFKMSSDICEILSGSTKDSKFLNRAKILAAAFQVVSTLLYYMDHPSLALAICKGYLRHMGDVPYFIPLHTLVWQFSCIHNDSSARKSWPLVRLEGQKLHPVLQGSCLPSKRSAKRFKLNQLYNPRDVAVNHQGDIIIASQTDVKVLSQHGALRFAIQHVPSDSASLFEDFTPVAIAVDTRDNIYVCISTTVNDSGTYSNKIQVFDKEGMQLHTFGKECFEQEAGFCKGGLAINTKGQMVVADLGKQCIYSLDLDGTKSVLPGCERVLAHQEEPFFLCTTNNDEIVVVTKDPGGIYCIYVLDSQGRPLRRKEIHLQEAQGAVGITYQVTSITYQPQTDHIILHVAVERRLSARTLWRTVVEVAYKHQLIFYEVKTLRCLNSFPLAGDTFTGGCISADQNDFTIVRVPDNGSICIRYRTLCSL